MFEKIRKLGEKRINQLGMHRYYNSAHYEHLFKFFLGKCNTFLKDNSFFYSMVINQQLSKSKFCSIPRRLYLFVSLFS